MNVNNVIKVRTVIGEKKLLIVYFKQINSNTATNQLITGYHTITYTWKYSMEAC